MFKLLKSLIFLVGLFVVAKFALSYFGYEINRDYFDQAKRACREELRACQAELLHNGIDNAQCSFECGDPRLLIKKK